MRSVICLAAAGWLLLSGCAHGPARIVPPEPSGGAGTAATNAPDGKLIVTPEFGLNGKVMMANQNLRFVVLNFPIGQMPAVDHRMNVYRDGLKVGEVKVNAQMLEDNVTADIVAGEAAVGDLVRDK